LCLGEKSPNRVCLRTRLEESRRKGISKSTAKSTLEAVIVAVKILVEFSEEHKNSHREFKEGLPLILRHLRAFSAVLGEKAAEKRDAHTSLGISMFGASAANKPRAAEPAPPAPKLATVDCQTSTPAKKTRARPQAKNVTGRESSGGNPGPAPSKRSRARAREGRKLARNQQNSEKRRQRKGGKERVTGRSLESHGLKSCDLHRPHPKRTGGRSRPL